MIITMVYKCELIWVVGMLMFFRFTAAFGFRNFQVPRQHAGRKLASDDNPGFISIDCGASIEYTDGESGLFYHTDDGFIDTGTNQQIPASVARSRAQLRTLRSFPEGSKNCYTLKPKQGKDNVYMIRATFKYGNYDGKNQTPTFDLYVGVSRWLTISLSALNENWCEITHVPSTNYISFCLVNINQGVPVISALELRHMPNSIYQVGSDAVEIFERSDTGSPTNTFYRYKGDAYDRFWQSQMLPSVSFKTWNLLTTTSTIDVVNSDNLYKPPPEMLQTAAQTQNASMPLNYYTTPGGIYLYYAYFHFAEIEELQPGKKREMVIYSNGTTLHEPFTLDYLKPRTIGPIKLPYLGNQIHFSIGATNGSDLPPILNGYEIFRAFELEGTPTNSEDIDAIMDIKMAYGVTKNWQGDPCVDTSWNGLNCSGSNYPRIISLNLSSSGLTGRITAAISNLILLQILDLSNNNLTGPLPTFLSEIPSLKVLDLSGNDFTGLIPEALMGKSANGTLSLRLDRNPNLCLLVPCKRNVKSFPLIPIIVVVSILMVLVFAALSIWWKCKRSGNKKDNDKMFKSKKYEFSFSEILAMTDNLKIVIGVGGFGTVYLGTLKSSLKVAVKLLSPESDQGLKEFLQEVKLLMRAHHGNVVSLVGYCKHPKHMALIYEYMPNGNVRQQLSDLSNVLTWKNRVQIAIHAAHGLEYLHNGCKPPIIHRDLKTANILLDENMQAKIADFGLSRAFRSEDVTHISTTNAVGTPGYIDPACLVLAHFSKSSDVFSFGVILMELVTGKPALARGTQNMHLLDWVVPQFEKGDIRSIVDQRLRENFNVDAAWKLVETAILCMHESPAQRPEINDVLAELKQCRVSERISSGLALGNMSSRSRQGNALEFNIVDNGEMTRPSAR